MGKPAICEKHGSQEFIGTSPRFAHSIDDGSEIKLSEIVLMRVDSSAGVGEYWIDVGMLKNEKATIEDGVLHLVDRDLVAKRLNDRLLIMRLVNQMKYKYVCPVCLRELMQRAN